MTVVDTAWLIGSVRDLERQVVEVNASLQQIAAGSYYLYSPTSSLSLIGSLEAAITAAGVAGASVVILENRKVRISAGATFSITWPADGVLQALLGYSGNLSGAATYTAPLISPLLWSPARPESPTKAPLGVLGHEQHQAFHSVSPFDGTRSVVVHGSRTHNRFIWQKVRTDRVQTDDELGGEYVKFWETVLSQGSLFYLWRHVQEDTAGSDPVVWTSSLGPYVVGDDDWDFGRASGFEWTDVWHPIELPCEVSPEYVNT